ncbi:hypothetical protein GCM10022228_14190 [Halomonas cibimaris]|uniref:Uncharacterized protein n=1 Tax=Halomonas cibimaris TaxID=657012 RepID=A0ABP7LPM4_9GAMM
MMIFAALIAGMLTGGNAQAAAFDVSDVATHGDWQTATLSRETTDTQERHFRAVETASYSDASLSVNATAGVCDMPWLEMRVALKGEKQTAALVPARVRVDDKTLHTPVAEFFTQPENDGFYAHFYLHHPGELFDEMREGEQLFLGFEQKGKAPWYMIFQLDGAGAAMNQALARCRRASGV